MQHSSLAVKATIVMPTVTPLIKVNRTKSYGAEVILHGDVYDDACAICAEACRRERDTHLYIRLMIWKLQPDREVSQWRLYRELPTVDYILAPIGGGGLITGVSTLAKMLNPKIKVIGVEPKAAASMTAGILMRVSRLHWTAQIRLLMVQL